MAVISSPATDASPVALSPIHTNALCRIYHLESSTDPPETTFFCPIQPSSQYLVVASSSSAQQQGAVVQWMPCPIASKGVVFRSPSSNQCVYVVELLLNTTQAEEAVATSDSSITTRVGTRLLFENELVNVWEFRIPPQATSHVHRHTFPYLFINLVESKTRGMDEYGEYMGDAEAVTQQRAGQVTFVPLQQEAIHAAENVGNQEFRQFIVEFKRT